MANNWQPPSASSAGWVPSGKGLRALMGGLVKGTAAWRGRKDEYAAQQLAIQQYEEEKEYKRKQDEYKRTQDQINAAMAKRQLEQERIYADLLLQDARKYAEGQKELEWEHEKEMERLKQRGKEKETVDIIGKEAQKHVDKLYDMDTDFGRRQATELEDAYKNGDVGKMQKVLNTAMANSDRLSSYGEGDKKKSANDYFVLTTAARNLIRLTQQKSGQTTNYGVEQVVLGGGAGVGKPSPLNTPEYREDRENAIKMMKEGKMNDAAFLMRRWKPFMTQKMAEQMEREAGLR